MHFLATLEHNDLCFGLDYVGLLLTHEDADDLQYALALILLTNVLTSADPFSNTASVIISLKSHPTMRTSYLMLLEPAILPVS